MFCFSLTISFLGILRCFDIITNGSYCLIGANDAIINTNPIHIKSKEFMDSSTILHTSNIPRTAKEMPTGRKIHNITTNIRTMIEYIYSPLTAITADREFAAAGSITSLHEERRLVNMMINTTTTRVPCFVLLTDFITSMHRNSLNYYISTN